MIDRPIRHCADDEADGLDLAVPQTMETHAPTDASSRRRWRFSLGGMMVFVLGCGVGLTYLRLAGGQWNGAYTAVLVAITFWIIVGLLHQARDLRRAGRQTALPRNVRCGLWFAILWRLAIAAVLAGTHALGLLDPETLGAINQAGWHIHALQRIALLVVFSSTCRRAVPTRPQRAVPLRAAVVGVCLAVYISLLARDRLLITFITHNTLTAIEYTMTPGGLAVFGIEPLPVARAKAAFWLGIGGAALIPWNLALIYFLARGQRGGAPRRLMLSLLGLGIAATGCILAWNCSVALPIASPFLARVPREAGLWQYVLVGLPCLLLLTTAVAYRWTAIPHPPGVPPQPALPAATVYFHESLGLLAMFGAWLLWGIVEVLVYCYDLPDFGTLLGTVMFTYPDGIVLLAAYILVPRLLLAFRRGPVPPLAPAQLPLARFVGIWLALATTFAMALPALAIYGFMLWLAPWYL